METDQTVAQTVRAAWCEVLGVESAADADNFFESGGHSFASVQLMTKIESALPIEFPLEQLFSDSLEEVVTECERRLAAASGSSAPEAGQE